MEQIKLVVWDLDETLWDGTLAENECVSVSAETKNIVFELTKRGIVNSVCSKNDYEAARRVLEDAGIFDYFVFPRISLEPKGESVREMLSDMGLRSANVLFIDDNHLNLEEVIFYNPGIQTLDASEKQTLLDLPEAGGNHDPEHKRLAQYKMMETRHSEMKSDAASDNRDFLAKSDIHIQITPSAVGDAERIHDMIMRTNQLNFTKKRISIDAVREIVADDDYICRNVRVYDRFGDHGIVGWYCLRGDELIHFLFSCRIINLGVEQSVYAYLGHPSIAATGETASRISACDTWADYITLDETPPPQTSNINRTLQARSDIPVPKLNIFALGACDLFYMIGHMATPLTNVVFECNVFNGDTRGVNVSTEYIRSCFETTPANKAFCRAHFHNYTGTTVFDTRIFAGNYDAVCLSFHDDFQLETYRSKADPGLRVVLSNSTAGSFTPILNPDGIKDFDPRKWLDDNFVNEGFITPERFRENLDWIYARLPEKTRLVLMTGPEYNYYRDAQPRNPAFRAQVIKLNKVIRAFAAEYERAALVEMNDVIFKREHFNDFILHLKPVYSYKLAVKMLRAISSGAPAGRVYITRDGENRKLALLGNGGTVITNYYILLAMGAEVDLVVSTTNEVPLEIITDFPVAVYGLDAIIGKAPEYYFLLLADGEHMDGIKEVFSDIGFRESDYTALPPTKFNLDWRE
jgi:FkbH-like protein